MIQAVHRLIEGPTARRALAAATVAVGLSGAAGVLALAGGATSSAHVTPARAAVAAPSIRGDYPYFLCIALLSQTGICIGPPTT